MSITLHPEALHEGASAQVRRLMPTQHQAPLDPFVFFDHFQAAAGAGFPDHPHRGFEAITYLMQGELRHADNLGNTAMLHAGEVQAFTAGRGLIHSELAGANEAVEGLQLWINLAQKDKTLAPSYQPPALPRKIMAAGYEMQLIVGHDAPIALHTPCWIALIDLAAGEHFVADVPADWSGFAYVLQGEIRATDGGRALAGEGLRVDANEALNAPNGAGFLLALGQAHGEPIIMRGPYVD